MPTLTNAKVPGLTAIVIALTLLTPLTAALWTLPLALLLMLAICFAGLVWVQYQGSKAARKRLSFALQQALLPFVLIGATAAAAALSLQALLPA